MSLHAPFPSQNQKSAYIRDDSLILYFETAETPLVARFDLNSLAQANFEVIKSGEEFALVLRDFSGKQQPITTFANKADAHQALYAILQALLSYGEKAKPNDCKKPSAFWCILKWIFFILLGLVVLAIALTWFASPTSQTAVTDTQNPASESTIPEGEPVDIDKVFVPSAPAADAQMPLPSDLPMDMPMGMPTDQNPSAPMTVPTDNTPKDMQVE